VWQDKAKVGQVLNNEYDVIPAAQKEEQRESSGIETWPI
jgi:hypothetical protein